ncbi:unnamed protein product [Parnassius apollo]|uniref:(apollo) hypothetical protein n=1 Tax=Parnassius apollo TaxID=110799 RepID=A0A8S3WMD8_PARAO|nr:unnamed protein product [Parnassius apollo]
MHHCVNCGLATGRCNTIDKRVLLDQATLSVIREWCAPEPVNNNNCACQACWDLAQEVVLSRRSIDEPRPMVQTSRICHYCWVLADRSTVHMISGPSTSRQNTMPQIQPQLLDTPIIPLEVQFQSPPTPQTMLEAMPEPVLQSLPQSKSTIVLPDYMRAIKTERGCFIEGCYRTEKHRVPLSTNNMSLNRYNYYVPENNRLCDWHLVIESWEKFKK